MCKLADIPLQALRLLAQQHNGIVTYEGGVENSDVGGGRVELLGDDALLVAQLSNDARLNAPLLHQT